ncbi:MAG: phosphatidylserine decarboxylase [Proteobacteria bacterium]|nr:phosphatidylserine decarboxylase [Pseudomonadota bacterium]
MSNIRDAIRSVMVPIHPDGWKFIVIFFLAAIVLDRIYTPLGILGLILTAWCAYFFRDPKRFTPTRTGLVISPADGMVQAITERTPPAELGLKEKMTCVSVFMNVFDVHVNRVPTDAVVESIVYRPGLFLNADLDKASEDNERMSIHMVLPDGRDMVMVQVAGLVARRILCKLYEGQKVQAGEKFGLIRFGSRVDVYLPKGVNPQVVLGQRMIAGETIIADLADSKTPAMTGEAR